MCGITGFIELTQSTSPRAILSRMMGSISHRGPDETGIYSDDIAFLGHQRLSIIDLSAGQQPMSNEDESLWIVYNGEIFNHADLRPELEAAGHVYRSHCDTETILHAYEQYGASCVDRFRGMFAFVIWDKRARKLFCVRDRLGIKPFYYWWDGRTFVFGSEIKAVLAHPSVSCRFESSLLSEYLALGFTCGEETLFQGIRKLMPGHVLELDAAADRPEPRTRQYWDVPDPGTPPARSDEEWIAECRSRLEETVRMRLMSDVPLGMFLSGGVDSSAIAALVARMIPSRLKTFSVGYDEAAYSELAWAKQVSDYVGTDHHEVRLGMKDFFDALPRLIWHEDEPITWPSSVSLYFVSRLAAEHVKVVLTGEGSDELFGGYHRYRTYMLQHPLMRAWGVVPGPVRRFVRESIAESSLLSSTLKRKAGHTVLGRDTTFEAMYVENFYSAFSREAQQNLLRTGHSGDALASFAKPWETSRGRQSLLDRLLYTDKKTYLVELLMKQDQMSMACSIESRVPFLDHTFVEFAGRVPDSLKIRSGSGKYILKKAVEDLLPNDITYRRKMGFPTPLRHWLREPAADPLFARLTDPRGFVAQHLDGGVVQGLVERHRSGFEDGTDRLWRLINLQVWGDMFFGSEARSFNGAESGAVAWAQP